MIYRRLIYYYIAMLLLPFLYPACTDSTPDIPEPGVSQDLARQRKEHLSDLRYELHFQVPASRGERLQGTAAISFLWKRNTYPMVLDFKVPGDHLEEVRVKEDAVPYTFENGHIVISARHFQEGENNIQLDFDLGDQSLNRQEEFLYTLLVPDRASTAFPCFDQPNLKARYQLTLTVPLEWEALGNGALESEQHQDGAKILKFAETRPIPTYLFDFVAGKFQKITWDMGDRSMNMLHRETDTASVMRNAPAIFDLHLSALHWLENYTGIEMPFQKFDFALIPSFQYGGMEHPGAITYKAASLFLDENATQNQELSRASLIAHETAHMWFGNLVTMNWFDDVWMKEVFANFMAAKIVNPSFPDIDHDLRFLLANYPSAYEVDRSAGTHPIQQPLENLKDAGSLYGAIIYQKAPIVMRMLEQQIGEEAMQMGLQEYLKNYAYGNATWDDLIAILDRQTTDDLEAWNRQWIKQAGMPHISVKTSGASQEAFNHLEARITNSGTEQLWTQKLLINSIGDEHIDTFQVALHDRIAELTFDTLFFQPQLIIANADGAGYGFFELDDHSKTWLLKNIQELESPMLRGVSWLTLWENMLHHRIDYRELMPPLIAGVRAESDPLIAQQLLAYLSTLYWKFLSETDRKASNELVENTLWNALKSTTDNRLKTALYNTYQSVAESEAGVGRLLAIWNQKLEVPGLRFSENDDIELVFHLAVREVAHSQDLLDQQLDRTKNADRKARVKFVMPALSPQESVRDSFFNSLKLEENRQVESWVQEALGWLHHPLRAARAEKYIAPTLELVEELQATGDIFFPKRVLDNTFSGHRSETAVKTVEEFLAGRPNYPENLRNKILQASDLTFRAAGK